MVAQESTAPGATNSFAGHSLQGTIVPKPFNNLEVMEYIYIYTYIHLYIYIYIYVCACVCVCVCDVRLESEVEPGRLHGSKALRARGAS